MCANVAGDLHPLEDEAGNFTDAAGKSIRDVKYQSVKTRLSMTEALAALKQKLTLISIAELRHETNLAVR